MKAVGALLILLASGLALLGPTVVGSTRVGMGLQNPIGPDGKPVPVPLSDESYHSLLFENDYARVLEVAIPPQKTTLLHKHDYDFVAVELVEGDVQYAFSGYALLTRPNRPGDTRFTHGPTVHQQRNPEGFGTYRNITVEIRKDSKQPYSYPVTGSSAADYNVLPAPLEPEKTYLVSVDRDTVRMSGVRIVGGESQSLAAGQGPLLIVAITDLELSATIDGEKKEVRMDRGEVLWDPPEFREKLSNTTRAPAQFVALEFK